MRGRCFPPEVVSGESDQSITEAAKGRGGSCICCHSVQPQSLVLWPHLQDTQGPVLKEPFSTGVSYLSEPLSAAPGSGPGVGSGSVPWQTSLGMRSVLTVPCHAPAAAVTH